MNWWANRLAGDQPSYGNRADPSPPAAQTRAASQVQPQHPLPNLPASSRSVENCPSCGSAEYMAAPGSNYKRCFSCGHPISQSGTGVGSTHTDGTVHKSVQVQTGSYSPQTIVGRVG
jgi:hypothetical protein